MDKFLLLVECFDAKGLIHKITGVISDNNLNIITNSEFVEENTQHFFMRSEIEGTLISNKLTNDLKKVLPADAKIKLFEQKKKKIVVMATKEHHCLGDLLIKNQFCEINAQILGVIANYDDLKPLVDKFDIPFHYVDHKNMSREEHEKKIIEIIDSYKPDYIVLAKYMRILTENFVSKYENHIINIHHSFLPAFIGIDPYEQAFSRGVKIIGATSHYVSKNLDEGPIIVQEIIHIDHKFTAKTMKNAGKEVEKIALTKALKLVFDERVFISGNKTIIFE
jgi:formyltetrahydrofolate deformylase